VSPKIVDYLQEKKSLEWLHHCRFQSIGVTKDWRPEAKAKEVQTLREVSNQ
jgi:hypothetical protein